MKRLTKACITILVLGSSLTIQAQNITGIWRGSFFNPAELAMGGARYRYEVQIDNEGRDAKGVTYSYQTTRFYGKASLVGVWSPSTKNLVLQEDKMLELKIADGGDGCLMTCYLTYRKEDGKEYLEGTYTSSNMNNKNMSCGGGRVFLEKVPDTDFEMEPFLEKKNNNSTSATKPKVKPGQEEYLVNKPPVKTTPPPPANKPPVTNTQPKSNSSGAKPPATATRPPATATKPPATATKPPATAKPPEVAVKPPPPAKTAAPSAKPPSTTSSRPQAAPTKPAISGSSAKAENKAPVPARPAEPVVKESGSPKSTNPDLDISATEPVKPKPVPPPPTVLKERKNELFKTFNVSQRIIEISFYDNGEVDGDTISVYNNNRLVASRRGLSAQPITIKVELNDDEPQQEVVMVAENLGSIPPNTALMIVKAGDLRYTLNLSSSEQKNAMVRFVYRP